MRLLIIPIIALWLLTSPLNGQDWVTEKLTFFSTIQFPSKPEKIDTAGQVIYVAEDSLALYMVTVRNMISQDSIELKYGELEEFYRGVVSGLLEASSGELLKKEEFELRGLKGIDIVYRSGNDYQLPGINYQRSLFGDQYVIHCIYWNGEDIFREENPSREKFFNSLTITMDNIIQYTVAKSDPHYRTGYIIGKIIGILCLIAIVFGIISIVKFLIRKFSSNRE